MKHFAMYCFLLYTSFLIGQNQPPDEAIERLNSGIDFFAAAQFTEAIKAYTSAIASDPDYFKAYYYRSQAHLQIKDHTNALRDLEKAQQLDPGRGELYGLMASIYYEEEQFQSVMEIVRVAEDLKLADQNAHLHRGLVFLGREQYGPAKGDFDKAIQLEPDMSEAYYNRGIVAAKTDQPETAINDFSVALQLKPQYEKARFARATEYFKLGNYDDALDDLHFYLATQTEDGQGYKLRGHTFYALKKYPQAIADYNLALNYFPLDPEVLHQRAGAFMSTQKYQKALGDLTIVIEQNGADPELLLERGYCHAKNTDHESAINDYTDAIRLQPDFNNAYFYRGQSYLVVKNYQLGCDDLLFARKKGHQKAAEIMKEHCKRNK
jgi:tetratricopeptide (TPR) repeat protein